MRKRLAPWEETLSVENIFHTFCSLFGKDPTCHYLINWNEQRIEDMDQEVGALWQVYQQTHQGNDILFTCKVEVSSDVPQRNTLFCYELWIENTKV